MDDVLYAMGRDHRHFTPPTPKPLDQESGTPHPLPHAPAREPVMSGRSSFRDRLQGDSPTYVTEATFWALGPQPCRLPAVPMQPLCPW